MLRRPRAVRRGFLEDVIDGGGGQERWMLLQDDETCASYVEDVLEHEAEPDRRAIWLLRQPRKVRQSYVEEVIDAPDTGSVRPMSYAVDFTTVSTTGLESSPVADALAGLRANEARYFKNKYDHDFTVEPASDAEETIELGAPDPQGGTGHRHRLPPAGGDGVRGRGHPHGLRLLRERAVGERDVKGPEKRAVGFKLSDGMEIPDELASSFKFARQRSKLAGTIRGSYFVIKNEY